jgi:hypothetical protein
MASTLCARRSTLVRARTAGRRLLIVDDRRHARRLDRFDLLDAGERPGDQVGGLKG